MPLLYFSLPMLFRYIFSGKYYQDSLKGMICTETNLTHVLQEENTRVEVATKPFLVIMSGHSIYLGLVFYFFFSAVKKRSWMQPVQISTKFLKLSFQEISSNQTTTNQLIGPQSTIHFLHPPYIPDVSGPNNVYFYPIIFISLSVGF